MNITTVDFSKKNKLEKRYSHLYAKLQKLFKDHYSADLVYYPFPDITSREDKSLKGLLANNDPLILGDKTLFPIKVDDEILGYAEITSKKQVLLEEASKMRDTLDLLLTKSLKSSKRLRELKEIESRFVIDHNYGFGDSNNVYSIETGLTIKNDFQSLQKPLFNKSVSRSNVSLDQSCFIISTNGEDRFKLANELHYLSNRYAFLNFNALDKENLDVNELNSIGSVTIYIDEIRFLNVLEQELILTFFKQRSGSTQPQFIATSAMSLESLKSNKDVLPELIDVLSSVHLVMTEEYSYYKKMNLEQLFITTSEQNHS